MNIIYSYKTQTEIKELNLTYKEPKDHFDAMNKIFYKYLNMDEKDCYIEFPLEAFKTSEFETHLNNYPVQVLKILKLENKSRFPNFDAIKEFLDIRFNMKNDNTDNGNPLSMVKREEDL